MNTNTRGFTLIELLVVIAIIALLSSVVLASLSTARAKARDARRASDIHQIYVALQLFADEKGYLPIPDSVNYATNGYGGNDLIGWDSSSQRSGVLSQAPDRFLPWLQKAKYLPLVPVDPINNLSGDFGDPSTHNGYAYGYYCYPNGTAGITQDAIRLGYWPETGSTTQIVWNAIEASPAPCQLLHVGD